MRIFSNADVDFYVDKPGTWGNYLKHGVTYKWRQPVKRFRPKNINYWRDNVAAKKLEITTEDLYFKNWPKTRIRPQACLGMLYSTGFRFIRLSKALPAGMKCAPLPVNLDTAYTVNGRCNLYGKIRVCV